MEQSKKLSVVELESALRCILCLVARRKNVEMFVFSLTGHVVNHFQKHMLEQSVEVILD